ncbi:MAG: hypothetical protein LH480_10120 [Rubrivivax sp.]|nr:hypothetical protein [Rubrivivax sp.]
MNQLVQPAAAGKPAIGLKTVIDVLSGGNQGRNDLDSASKTVASVGKMASLFPGVGTAVSAACGVISGVLSFLASPCG